MLSGSGEKVWTDKVILFCIGGLILILPIAHTTSIRAFLLWIPFSLWVFNMYKNKRWDFKRTPLEIPLLLFFITIVLSFFTSLKISVSISELRGEFLTYTMLFYLVTNNIKTEKNIQDLVIVLFLGSLIMAIYAIADYFIYSNNIFDMSYRTGSLHQGYEAYAEYIILVAPFNVLAFFYRKDLAGRAVLSFLLILNCSALYLTHTRGAWLALYVELLLIIGLIFKSHTGRWIAVAFMITVVLLTVLFLPEDIIWHGKKGINISDNTASNTVEERLIVWKNTLNEFIKEPFKPAGYGKVNFSRRFAGDNFLNFDQSHNTFINTAVQLGIQGLIVLLVIIYFILRMSWGIWKRGETEFQKYFSISVFVMTIGFFTANQFAEFYIDDTALLFWLFIGLLTSIYTQRVSHTVK